MSSFPNSTLFGGFLDYVTPRAQVVRFRTGQSIIAPGQLPEGVFVVRSGKARLLAQAKNDSAPGTLAILEPGDDFGAISLVMGRVIETVLASTDTECMLLRASDFLALAQADKELRNRVLARVHLAELFLLLQADYHRRAVSTSGLREVCREAHRSARALPEATPQADSRIWLEASKERFGQALQQGGPLRRLIALEPIAPPLEPEVEEPKPEPALELATVPPETSTPVDYSVENYIEEACRSCGVEFPREPVRRFLARIKSPTLRHLASAARIAGLDPTLLTLRREELKNLKPPALVLHEGAVKLVTANRGGALMLHGEGAVESDKLGGSGEELELVLLSALNLSKGEKFSLRRLIPVIKEHKRVLVEVFVASLFVQLFALANPLITQVVIDKVLVQNSPQTLNVLGTLLIVIALAGAVLGAVRTFLFTDTTNRIDLKLGGQVIDHLYRLTLSYFQRRPVGEISSRVHELENIRQFLTGTALTIVLDALFSVIYIVVMVLYSVQLSIVALLALPLLAGITAGVTPLYRKQLRTRAEHYAASQSHLVETLTGAQTVKAQSLEQRSLWEWQKRYSAYVAAGFRAMITSTTTGAVTGFLSKLSDLAVLWYGAWLVIDGQLTLGQLIAFRIIAGYVTNPMLRLVQSWQSFQEVGLSIERLGDVLDSPMEQSESENARIPMPEVKGQVTLENVTFHYTKDRAPQLRNVSFQIPEGSFVGVVGLSGSGKSTLVKLLPRLLTPDHGRVLIDDYDINKVELYSLRNQIGTVLQDTILLNLTIRENIALSKPEAEAEEIIAAARIACAHEFIMNLPEGYETRAGEQGRGLSGGQRQRISIARAVLQNPRMLVLDEATSALDFPTERQVCQNLRDAFRQTTTFFVTHRLPSIQKADWILVMEDGVIVESGHHNELMELNGTYANLHRRQEASFS